jgi:hypothetical protein
MVALLFHWTTYLDIQTFERELAFPNARVVTCDTAQTTLATFQLGRENLSVSKFIERGSRTLKGVWNCL